MQKSWIEDFERKYNKPIVEPITVGFSGLDPTPKYIGGSGEAVADEVLKKLEELEIRIDSGNIDPDTPEPAPSPSPAPVIQTENDHEKLNNLLGGNSDGHYHLTEDELEKLQNMPAQGSQGADGKAATIHIGTVSAGSAGSTPRVTNTGTATDAVLNFVIPKGDKGDKGEQGIPGIQGNTGEAATIKIGTITTGAAGSKANVTNSGTENNAVLNFVIPKGDKGDTGAVGAKGDKGDKGNTFNFDDLTDEQLDTLKNKIGGGTGNHEELTNLQGGTDNEHYHIEEAQHHKLEILIKALFPTGTDDIYIPYIDDRDPDNPKILPYTPFVDLPKGNPPEWEIHTAFANGATWDGVKVPYYGKFNDFGDCLAVFCEKSAYYIKEIGTFANLTIGNSNSFPTVIGVYKTDGGYLDNYLTATKSIAELIFLSSDSTSNMFYAYSISADEAMTKVVIVPSMYGKNSNGSTTTGTIYSAVVSPELGVLLIAPKSGYCYRKTKGGTSFGKYSLSSFQNTSANNICPNGLAWSPVAQLFCAATNSGIETSADGMNWVAQNGTPKNLTDLTYREDLEVFFARGLSDKLFYASGDGITWKNVTITPIPLYTVACVDFCKDTGIYCAVGGTSEFAYFSKDLTTWVPTKITNGANIEAGSVIYMPSTKKYVLFPTSGSYYYTFDPSAWID